MRGDVACDDRSSVRGRLKESKRESLEPRRKHECGGVRVQLFEGYSVYVPREHDAWIRSSQSAKGICIVIREARPADDHEAQVASDVTERSDKEVRSLFWDETSNEEKIGAVN